MSGCSQCGYDWVACECDDGQYEDDDCPCDCSDPDIDLIEGTSTCYECGARRYLSTEELDRAVAFMHQCEVAWDEHFKNEQRTHKEQD